MVKAEGASNVELSLAAVSAAVIAAGVESVKMAGDFQQSMTQLVTGAGESRNNLKAVSDGILQMSIDTATGTDKLAAGMFNVESASYHGSQGLLVLKAAAEGARAENANLAQTTDVLTTTMHGMHASASQAIPIMNSLIATERDGKMRMDDLTGAMKNVLPVSAALHIHLADVEGALATMAASGDKGASAGTHLAMMFKMLENPASSAAKEMRAMGIDSVNLAETMSTSLPDALKMIQDAVAQHFTPGSVEYERAIAKILGGSKSGIAGLELLGANFKNLAKNTDDAAEALRKGGVDVENWDLIQKNFNFQLEAAANAVNVLMIKVGTALLPVLSQLFEKVSPTISAFSQWIDKSGILSGVTQTLSGWVGKLGEAFNYIADAFDQAFNRGNNLMDTFDHATAVIKPLEPVMKTLTDTFDRASGVMSKLDPVMKPVLDTFDRATGVLDHTAGAVQGVDQAAQGAPNSWIPFWTFVKNVIADVKRIDWGSIGAGLERIRVAISKMDWCKVGAFFSGIATSISQVDWGKVGQAIQNIAIGFTKVDWGKVGASIAAIAQAFTSVDWKKLGTDIGKIVTDLSKVDWGSIANGIATAVKDVQVIVKVFQSVVDSVYNLFKWLYDKLVGHSIIPDLINGIVTWFASLPGKLAGVITGTVGKIVAWFGELPGKLRTLITTLVSNIASWWGDLPGKIGAFAGSIISNLVSPFQSAANTISGIVGTIGGWISNLLGQIGSVGPAAAGARPPGFASGIENFGGGLAYVHAGEVLTYLPPGSSVTPANRVSSSSFGGGQPVQININIAGHRVAQALLPDITSEIRRATGVRF